jgi:hypothetical protein
VIPNRTWRAWAVGAVLGADGLTLLVAGSAEPSFLPFALGVLAVVTLWALRRPAGWGAFTLVLVQVLVIAVPTVQPRTALAWVLTAASAAAVLLTHLALTLLGSWPRRADLPRATARRWLVQAAALVWVGVAAALVGLVASSTPPAWIPWLAALALALVAGLAWQLRAATRRG